MKFTHSLFFPTKLQLQTKQQIFANPELVDVKLPELTLAASIRVRDNPSSNGFIVVTRTTAPKLTVPPIHHSIQTKQQQIIANENLVGIFLPVLTTSNFVFQVRNE